MNPLKILLTVLIIAALAFIVIDLSSSANLTSEDYKVVEHNATNIGKLLHTARRNTLRKESFIRRQAAVCDTNQLVKDMHNRIIAARALTLNFDLAVRNAITNETIDGEALGKITIKKEELEKLNTQAVQFTQGINNLDLVPEFVSPMPLYLSSTEAYLPLEDLNGSYKAIWRLADMLIAATAQEMEDLPADVAARNASCVSLGEGVAIAVLPESRVVRVGEPYKAKMFLYGGDYFIPRIGIDSSEGETEVNEFGSGKISFTAAADTFDENGEAKKTLTVKLTVPDLYGFQEFEIEQPYTVLRK